MEEARDWMKLGTAHALVGVATVDPIDDFLLNSFLSLPTECIAILNAEISIASIPLLLKISSQNLDIV